MNNFGAALFAAINSLAALLIAGGHASDQQKAQEMAYVHIFDTFVAPFLSVPHDGSGATGP